MNAQKVVTPAAPGIKTGTAPWGQRADSRTYTDARDKLLAVPASSHSPWHPVTHTLASLLPTHKGSPSPRVTQRCHVQPEGDSKWQARMSRTSCRKGLQLPLAWLQGGNSRPLTGRMRQAVFPQGQSPGGPDKDMGSMGGVEGCP